MRTRMLSTVFLLAAALPTCGSPATAQQEGENLWQPYYIGARTGQQHVALNGEWDLAYRDMSIESLQDLGSQQKWIQAQVPSSVQWALYRAGELPNPYLHMNARKYDWVVEKVWYYRKSFQVPSSARGQYVFLCFDGIDYYAEIWLNGEKLGHHEGMFNGPIVEVSSLLRTDAPNEPFVEVRAASYGLGEKWKPWSTGKVTVPWGLTEDWVSSPAEVAGSGGLTVQCPAQGSPRRCPSPSHGRAGRARSRTAGTTEPQLHLSLWTFFA